GPRKGPAVDIGHHIGNILLSDDADDVSPAHDRVVIGTRRGGGERKRDHGSNCARSGNALHLLLHRLPRGGRTAGNDCPSSFGFCNGRIGRAWEDRGQWLLKLWRGIHTSAKYWRVTLSDAAPCR